VLTRLKALLINCTHTEVAGSFCGLRGIPYLVLEATLSLTNGDVGRGTERFCFGA
jgi:hypothetical protein